MRPLKYMLFGWFFGCTLACCCPSTAIPTKSTDYPRPSTGPIERQTSEDCFAAVSIEVYDRLHQACVRKDQEYIQQLVLEGKVVVLRKHTKVVVVRGGYTSKVEVLDGDYAGRTFYLAKEFLQ